MIFYNPIVKIKEMKTMEILKIFQFILYRRFVKVRPFFHQTCTDGTKRCTEVAEKLDRSSGKDRPNDRQGHVTE